MQCAVKIQRDPKAKNTELPAKRQMEFHIGINVGDVIVEGPQIYGDGINIATRLEALAEGGGICISGTVYDFEFYQMSSQSGQRSEMLGGCLNPPIQPRRWPDRQYTWLRVRSIAGFARCLGAPRTASVSC